MSPLFGQGKAALRAQAGKTVLALDVESGSVGCALVRASEKREPPKLIAETRVALPVFTTLRGPALTAEIEKTAREALLHASTVAARIRAHPAIAQIGAVSQAVLFLGPPWTTLAQAHEHLAWEFEPALVRMLHELVGEFFPGIPVSFHAFGDAAARTADALFDTEDALLLCNVTGEVTELLVAGDGATYARATFPAGAHTVLRTLGSHAGLTQEESRSLLALLRHADAPVAAALAEPLTALGQHFTEHFADVTPYLTGALPIRGVLVIAADEAGEWFARTIANAAPLSGLFADGTAVQALHTRHLMPHVAAHAAVPDLGLLLEAIFVSGI